MSMGSQPVAMLAAVLLAAVLLAAVLLAAAMLVGSLLPTLRGPESSCSKSFGERCALEGLPEGVLSPNAAKSASLVMNVPCRAF